MVSQADIDLPPRLRELLVGLPDAAVPITYVGGRLCRANGDAGALVEERGIT